MSEKRRAGSSKVEIETVLGVGRAFRARWRRWLVGGLVLLVAAGAGYYWVGSGNGGGKVQYGTETATTGDIVVTVTATGTIQPTNEVQVSSELSGIVRSVNVDYNSQVKAGDVLAVLDTDKLSATVDSARAQLSAAKANVQVAEATVTETQLQLKRAQSLASRQAGTVQNLDSARAANDRAIAALASAKAEVAAAEADLKLNETNLEKAQVRSPINGTVLDRNVEPGQVVAASLQAPTLFTIAEDLTKMEAQVDVDEADVGKVHEGQKATFTVDAYPGRSFNATISQLRFGSQVVQGVVTYKAVLEAENPDLLLRPGMTATAEITVAEVKNALTVPNEALRFTPPAQQTRRSNGGLLSTLLRQRFSFREPTRPELTGPNRTLWVLRDGVATRVPVKVGATDGTRTQIVAGKISPGEKVIVDAVAPAG